MPANSMFGIQAGFQCEWRSYSNLAGTESWKACGNEVEQTETRGNLQGTIQSIAASVVDTLLWFCHMTVPCYRVNSICLYKCSH